MEYAINLYSIDPRIVAESGYLVMVDINGDKGKGRIWDDVFPFYLTDSGKVIPGYPVAGHKRNGSDESDTTQDSQSVYIGGNNPAFLSADVYYFENESAQRHKVTVHNAISFARAACISELVNPAAPYCMNLGLNYAYRRDNEGNILDDNPCITHKCHMKIRKKSKFL